MADDATSARAAILASSRRFWSAEDAPGHARLLAELARSGALLRVRRGLYWRGVKTALGMSPPPPEALVDKLVGHRGVGPAGPTAANRLRLSTQVPRREQLAVPERPPVAVGPVTFVSRAGRPMRRTASLTTGEVALLEVLDGWSRVIEVPLPEAWARLSEMIRHDEGSARRLTRASITEPARVRARLAALLIASGFSDLAAQVPAVDARTARRALPRDPLEAPL